MNRACTPDDAVGSSPQQKPSNPLVPWLVVITILVGLIAFWVIATPHEQCYISDGSPGVVERPIERSGGGTYRGIPSEFQDGDFISSDAVIDCGWALGQPYRMTLFGG